MIVLIVILSLVFLADAVRLRGRVFKLKVLGGGAEEASPDHKFVTAAGVALDDAVRRAASAYARTEKLDVVDLIPGNQATSALMSLLQVFDPATYRTDRLATGRTAGHAFLATAGVLERARLTNVSPADPVAFVKTMVRLKRHACLTTDIAVAPGLVALAEDPNRRKAVLREMLGEAYVWVLVIQPIMIGLVWMAALRRPYLGLLPLVLYHLQPLLAVAGSKLRPRDLAPFLLLRSPLDMWNWANLVFDRWRPGAHAEAVEALRPVYQQLLAGGVDRFLEPRRDTCPLCNGKRLAPHFRNGDLLQHKAGSFTLEQCEDCRHIFQNPRLTIEGLNFYYRDFYDGLGGEGVEAVFGFSAGPYRARAKTIAATVPKPGRWLDVGAGHGHLCCVASEVFPDTEFEGLDLSDGIEEAVRRGWIKRAHRGLFPDLAAGLAGHFDVVTMSHYLEHTRDPRAELIAAHTALCEGGHLLVEIPDPECPFRKLLGRYWVPWFQPQHQHLLNTANLKKLLEESGLEAVVWIHNEAHVAVDFMFAVIMAMGETVPPADLPWQRPSNAVERWVRQVAWVLTLPFFGLAYLCDSLSALYVARFGGSNAIRVLARKKPADS